jgi:uracil phosphoribosyltransferase
MNVTTEKLVVVDHPLVQHKLGMLRDDSTPTHLFRELVDEVTLLLTYEATKGLATEEIEIETPLERTTVQRISGKKVAACSASSPERASASSGFTGTRRRFSRSSTT